MINRCYTGRIWFKITKNIHLGILLWPAKSRHKRWIYKGFRLVVKDEIYAWEWRSHT